MLARKSLSTWLCVTMAAGALAAPAQAQARFPSLPNPMVAHAADPAAVLGLEGPDDAASKALTDALREAFARRGLGGQEKLSLAEVRLAMGCQGDDPGCLSEAGRSLGVDKLIYGSLEPQGGGDYSVELHILDVEQAVEESYTTTPLDASDLTQANIDATATRIVNSLFPEPSDPEIPTTPIDDDPIADEVGPEPVDEPRQSKLVWGKYDPRPTWKWAGFGVGIGLVVLGGAGAIGTAVPLSTLNTDLVEAADESLMDCLFEQPDGTLGSRPCREGETDFNMANDVDKDRVDDICEAGSEEVADGAVRNKKIYGICEQGDTLEVVNRVSFAMLGVGVVVTAVFTTLLFVHRREPGVDTVRRRGLRLTASPTPDGGFMVGGGMNF